VPLVIEAGEECSSFSCVVCVDPITQV
jgi:hypothetical protein